MKKKARKKEEVRVLSIPTYVFRNRSLSVLESLTVYLKEKKNLKYSEIARILNRDDRTVWTAYNRAKNKQNESK